MARKQMFAEGTRNHILEVATRLFFEKGFDCVSVRGLMKQVGADPGGFYYYFESKEALWEEVLQAFFSPWVRSVAQCEPDEELILGLMPYDKNM